MRAARIPASDRLMSAADLERMGAHRHHELIEGRLIEMSPTSDAHGEIELTIAAILREFVRRMKLGRVSVGEVGMYIRRNPDTVRAADALYISHERYAQRGPSAYLDVAPELVIEVLSPHDAWGDVIQKLRDYLSFGVQLVWIIDPGSRTIHAYRSMIDLQIFEEDMLLDAGAILPSFSVPVAEIFAE
jgi:Uma2 family endonuclease